MWFLHPSLSPWSRFGMVTLLRGGFCSGSFFGSASMLPVGLHDWSAAECRRKDSSVPIPPSSCWDAEKVDMKKKTLKLRVEKSSLFKNPLRAGFYSSHLPMAAFCQNVFHEKCTPSRFYLGQSCLRVLPHSVYQASGLPMSHSFICLVGGT